MVNAADSDRWTAVRLATTSLNGCVGLLFWFRAPVQRHGSVGLIAAALPSVLVSGWAMTAAPDPHLWPIPAQAAFVIGTAFAVLGLVSLGRSFSILPALRDIVRRGPFGWIRHPIYLGELIMLAACGLAAGSATGWGPVAVALPTLVVRILAEERLLGTTESYRLYRAQVRHRLLPGVW
jgi:protein-S-isoprenylcysteine O-methyltransferase Ste14